MNHSSPPPRTTCSEELQRMVARDPSSKAIVFSQFTSMLDLVGFRLEQVGWGHSCHSDVTWVTGVTGLTGAM